MGKPLRVDQLDLPREVLEVLSGQGLEELYPPQADAIGPALAGKNLVLALPTASGKSLVAYLAVVKKVLEGGRALYIVPLRALASEKLEDLKAFERLGIRVGVSTGDYDSPGEFLQRYDIVVATSEKADSLLRHRARWLNELSIIVADEVHLIGDPDRGPTLEVILSRFRQLNPRAQLLALSATIPNSRELAEWMGAEHFSSEWRPVKLKEGVLYDGVVRYTDNTKRVVGKDSKEPTFPLIEQVLREGGQVLMFVNTRKSAETMAGKAGALVRKCMGNGGGEAAAALASELEGAEVEHTSMARRLAEVLANGAAFHHAGLTAAQRKLVEAGFKAGKLKLLTATPTLAAGINLPARVVIIRDTKRYEAGYGQGDIPVGEIKQMAGRAGRPKYDKVGEAVVVARNDDDEQRIFDHVLMGETAPVDSKLGDMRSLRIHALSSVATGFAASTDELRKFFDSTFYAHQSPERFFEEATEAAVDFLVEEEMVERTAGGELRATLFGKRVSELYIDPLSAKTMRGALKDAGDRPRNSLAYLHLAASTPDLSRVGMYMRKGDVQWLDKVADLARKEFLTKVPDDPDEYEWFLADLKLACMLQDWIDEKSEEDISERYDVGPGDIRTKVETGRWILYSMREIARLQRYPFVDAIDGLHRRVEEGIRAELLELVRLRGVGRVRARALFNFGYRTLEELGRAGLEKIARVPKIGPKVAQMIVDQLVLPGEAPSPKHDEDEHTQRKLEGDAGGASEKDTVKKSYFD